MSVAAVVEQVGEMLGRAHALFGDPPISGGAVADRSAGGLSSAGQLVTSGIHRISAMSGEIASGYGSFAGKAGPALDALAGADGRLSEQLQEAAHADRSGRTSSGTIVNAAAADTAALSPVAGTPAGERALLTALRERVAHQQRVVAAYRTRDARMAALLRSLAYAGGGGLGTGMPAGGGAGAGVGGSSGLGAFGGGLGSLWGASGSGNIGGGGSASDRGSRTSNVVRAAAVRDIPAGPAGVAVRAALSKLGTPYVWGAEGPSQFDCSGLTEWAWRQAGVQLGDDTYAQVKQGMPVPEDEVRAGDLIFPKDLWDGRGPGHVQLAISPTQVVHAPQSGDVVRITEMPASFVARRPVPLS